MIVSRSYPSVKGEENNNILGIREIQTFITLCIFIKELSISISFFYLVSTLNNKKHVVFDFFHFNTNTNSFHDSFHGGTQLDQKL